MTGRPDVATRRGGSAAVVARVGRTDAVSAGIAHGSDEGALSATRRGGAASGASAAAAKAVRLEDRRRRAAEAADWALGGDRDGDGDHDASDDAIAIAEGRLKRRMYDRLSDGMPAADGEASTLTGARRQDQPVPTDRTNEVSPPVPTQARHPHQRTLASRANADAPLAPTETRRPRQRIDTEGVSPRSRHGHRHTPRHDSRVASTPSRPGRLSRSGKRSI